LLIPPKFLAKWFQVAPKGVLHVGAHLAEEFHLYRDQGFGKTFWVEAQQELVPKIRKVISSSDDEVYQGAVWSKSGDRMTLQITNNGQSTSLYRLAEHLVQYPKILPIEERVVPTIRLDELIPHEAQFDFVNLDIQGAELEALRGMGERLKTVKWVYAEVNKRMLYEGIPLVDELDAFLSSYDLHRVATAWTGAGWGDALYSRGTRSVGGRLLNLLGVMALKLHLLGGPRGVARRLRKRLYGSVDRLRGFSR